MTAFRIFVKHPTADAYHVGGSYSPYCLVSQDKRFTGAELAAEYWMLSSRRERMLGYDDGPGSETRKQAHQDRERMNTIHRFITNPSYDE